MRKYQAPPATRTSSAAIAAASGARTRLGRRFGVSRLACAGFACAGCADFQRIDPHRLGDVLELASGRDR